MIPQPKRNFSWRQRAVKALTWAVIGGIKIVNGLILSPLVAIATIGAKVVKGAAVAFAVAVMPHIVGACNFLIRHIPSLSTTWLFVKVVALGAIAVSEGRPVKRHFGEFLHKSWIDSRNANVHLENLAKQLHDPTPYKSSNDNGEPLLVLLSAFILFANGPFVVSRLCQFDFNMVAGAGSLLLVVLFVRPRHLALCATSKLLRGFSLACWVRFIGCATPCRVAPTIYALVCVSLEVLPCPTIIAFASSSVAMCGFETWSVPSRVMLISCAITELARSQISVRQAFLRKFLVLFLSESNVEFVCIFFFGAPAQQQESCANDAPMFAAVGCAVISIRILSTVYALDVRNIRLSDFSRLPLLCVAAAILRAEITTLRTILLRWCRQDCYVTGQLSLRSADAAVAYMASD